MSKRILKIISIFAATIAGLIVLTLLFFSGSPGENIIKGQLVKTINSKSGLSVTIGRFETNLFSRIQLDEITVISPISSNSDSLLYINKIKVTYSIFDLLFGDTNLKSAVIDNVNLNISVDSLGNYGIPMLDTAEKTAPDEEGTSVSISIDKMLLSQVNAIYSDKRIPVDINLYNLSSHINGRGKAEYDGMLCTDSVIARYEGEPFLMRKLQCDFIWDGEKLSVTSTADIEDIKLNAGVSLRIPELDGLFLNGTFEGNPTNVLKILKKRYELPPVEVDDIIISAEARGSIKEPEIALRITSGKSRVENIDLDTLRLYARYSSNMVSVDTATVKSLGGDIWARGFISLEDTATTDVDLRIENIEMSELWGAIYKSESPFGGNLNGSVRAKGKVNNISGWDINGRLDISNLRYQDRPAADLGLKFSVLNDTAQMTLVHDKDTIRTAAVLKNGNMEGEFYADIPEISSISRFANIPDLKGNIIAEGTFGGSTENPLVKIRLKGDKISYQNFPVDNLTGDIQYRDSSIIINSLKLSGRRPDSAMHQNILGVDSLYGEFEYSCDVRGSMDYLDGELSVKIVSLEYPGYTVDSAFAAATVRGSNVDLDSLNVYFRDIVFRSSGSYDTVSAKGNLKTNIFSITADSNFIEERESRVNIEMVKRGIISTEFGLSGDNNFKYNIKCDTVWVGLLKSLFAVDAPDKGFLNLRLNFEGSLANPAGSLSASAYSISHPSYEIDSVIVAAELDDDYLRLEKFRLFAYGNSIYANTDIYLDRDSDNTLIWGDESAISGEMAMENLDLSILQPYVTPTGALAGKASANMTWDGTRKNPGLEGRVDITDGYLKYTEASNALDKIHLRLNLSDSLLTIDSASCYSSGTPLSVKGAVKYKFPEDYDIFADLSVHNIVLLSVGGRVLKDSLDLRIFSDNFDLEILRPFLTMADSLGGDLKSEVHISGKLAMPGITGFIKVSDFSLLSSELSANIKSGLLDARFDRTRVDIDSLYADINGGSMVVSGYLVHDAGALTDINLILKASNISYEKADIFKAKLQSADLNYGRKEDQYFLDGDISLGESRLTAKFPLKSILPWARSVETVEYELPDIIARTRLNVRFRENDDLWIDNNLANIRMKAELGIIGTPVRPNISGLVRVEEGYLIYLDRRFKNEEGNLYLSDPLKLNPDIMLHAKTQVTEYQRTVAQKYVIHIKVEGDLENLRPDIYSEPPLDKSDIIALLTLGATRSSLTGREEAQSGGVKNALVERAAGLTSNRISGFISDKVGSMFGFDEFTVEGNLFRFDDSWGPRLVASRRISKRVELTYSTTVGHLNDQGVRLGYKLTPRLSIQGETDQAGRSGIDLRYGLKFK
ncbi:MAG: translocation/assembly module TamB domain-containing protein [Candidatus Zixiibacteriota bacterium]|nr:MAG: translocation/assembly module TamB domain-containing protein [candidate division Zixibacteria bacterium]